jgi:hypothetical protein
MLFCLRVALEGVLVKHSLVLSWNAESLEGDIPRVRWGVADFYSAQQRGMYTMQRRQSYRVTYNA